MLEGGMSGALQDVPAKPSSALPDRNVADSRTNFLAAGRENDQAYEDLIAEERRTHEEPE